MRAYKYRSPGNVSHVFDIILRRRLRCSPWQNLNDPMEGYFELTGEDVVERRQFIYEIVSAKADFRVCSLSLSPDNPLLWAHYAQGFAGFVIEVEIPHALRLDDARFRDVAQRRTPFVAHVDYRKEIAFGVDGRGDRRELASRILLSKYRAWKYEKEVRVISRDDWFPVVPTRVIAGPRVDPALLEGLQRICGPGGIEVCQLRVDHEGIRLPRRRRRA